MFANKNRAAKLKESINHQTELYMQGLVDEANVFQSEMAVNGNRLSSGAYQDAKNHLDKLRDDFAKKLSELIKSNGSLVEKSDLESLDTCLRQNFLCIVQPEKCFLERCAADPIRGLKNLELSLSEANDRRERDLKGVLIELESFVTNESARISKAERMARWSLVLSGIAILISIYVHVFNSNNSIP